MVKPGCAVTENPLQSPSLQPASDPVFLGLDTGGTYTDAVLWSQAGGVIAKAKALTTRHDLAVGIAEAAGHVLAAAAIAPSAVKLASMSTTLATNALVEGQGGRSALVMIGFSPAELERAGLARALGTDPVVFVPGGHDVHGNETPLDLSALEAALPELAADVSAVAVCGYFATRNPAHEIAASDLVRRRTGLPVTASHELSSRLGGPKRALTTLLNARLIAMLERLVEATEGFLSAAGIAAPLMVVRGDGALVSAGFARRRPVETILSGPAASLVGARHLTGLDDAVVSDIGGTTTDIAVMDGGLPRLDPEGATVGGFRTMVEAVAMRTWGLGGDSEVALEDGAIDARILLGPRRLVPLSLAATQHGAVVLDMLEQHARNPVPGRFDGRLAVRSGLPKRFEGGLTAAEARMYEAIGDRPAALDRLLASNAQMATLNRLVARGLVHICGFTPSDAAHVLGRQANWDAAAARLGAVLFARRRDGRGLPIATSPEGVSRRVLDAVSRRSAEIVLETAFAEDGLDGAATVASPSVQRALSGTEGIARLSVRLDRPLIGLGASAALHYDGLGTMLGTSCVIPRDADVANALGAVVGQVRVSVEGTVGQPEEGRFRVSTPAGIADFRDEDEALDHAETVLRGLAGDRAAAAGAVDVEFAAARDIRHATVEGSRRFVEANVAVSASGRPRIAR